MKKIDIHCHTSDRPIRNILPKDATIDTIAENMEKHDIEKTVLLATYFPHKKSGISNFRLLHWIKERPEFYMFGSLDFEHFFFQGLNEMEELASKHLMKGIKIYTCYQKIDLESKDFGKVTDIARRYSLPMMFHSGFSYATCRKYGDMTVAPLKKPSDIEKVAIGNPDINVIISHMGKPFLDDLINVINRNTNVYTDMSGLIDSKFDQKDIPNTIESIKRFLGECGSGNLLFGTDFPVQTHEHSIYFIEEAMKSFSSEDKEEVYYKNASELLKI